MVSRCWGLGECRTDSPLGIEYVEAGFHHNCALTKWAMSNVGDATNGQTTISTIGAKQYDLAVGDNHNCMTILMVMSLG